MNNYVATIEEASSTINHCLQEQAQKLQSKYCNAKTLQNVRVTELLKAIDPVLLSFIKITWSVNENRN